MTAAKQNNQDDHSQQQQANQRGDRPKGNFQAADAECLAHPGTKVICKSRRLGAWRRRKRLVGTFQEHFLQPNADAIGRFVCNSFGLREQSQGVQRSLIKLFGRKCLVDCHIVAQRFQFHLHRQNQVLAVNRVFLIEIDGPGCRFGAWGRFRGRRRRRAGRGAGRRIGDRDLGGICQYRKSTGIDAIRHIQLVSYGKLIKGLLGGFVKHLGFVVVILHIIINIQEIPRLTRVGTGLAIFDHQGLRRRGWGGCGCHFFCRLGCSCLGSGCGCGCGRRRGRGRRRRQGQGVHFDGQLHTDISRLDAYHDQVIRFVLNLADQGIKTKFVIQIRIEHVVHFAVQAICVGHPVPGRFAINQFAVLL